METPPKVAKKSGSIRKIVIVAALIFAVVAGTAVWLLREPPKAIPQYVTFENGVQYEFMKATYGTNHVIGTALSERLHKMPSWFRSWALKLAGKKGTPLATRTTATDAL